MASTNEDVTVLASAAFEDGCLLVLRLLPDRGTIELGWWQRDELGITAQLPVLEIAAEAPELRALIGLCRQARDKEWQTLRDGDLIASVALADGATLSARRSGEQLLLARQPERDDQVLLAPIALDLLVVEMLPAAAEKLDALGFGMVQQEA